MSATRAATRRASEKPWHVRASSLLVAVWAAWLLAFVVWAWAAPELRAGDNVALGYTMVSLMALVAVAVGIVVAARRPGWGAIVGGLLVTLVGTAGSAVAVDKLNHWDEVGDYGLVRAPGRTTPWVPLDSLGFVPYWALLAVGIVLVAGGVVQVLRATRFAMPAEGLRKGTLQRARAASWTVRAALLLAGVWALWLLAFVVWAWAVPELRSGDGASSYTAGSVIVFVIVAAGLLAAIWRPGRGEIGGGFLMTVIAAAQGGAAVDRLAHWGESVDGATWVHRATWVPLDSLGAVPYWVLLAAGVLLVLGGVDHVLHPTDGFARAALLLIAVWAIWLFAFVAWGWSIPEWQSNNFYFGYTVWAVLSAILVAGVVIVALQWQGWGEIAGGLLIVGLAQFGSRDAVTELKSWGEIVVGLNEDRGSPWVPLDSIDQVPFWALLAAGVLFVVAGIVHVAHPTHHTTLHVGAAT